MPTYPAPSDLRVFWNQALSELERVSPREELLPAEFEHPACKAFHLTYDSVGGARIHAKLLAPKQGHRGSPGLLLFHGYTANSGDWWPLAAWAAAGFTVAAMDCRGQGGDSYDPGGAAGQTLHGHLIRGLEQGAEALAYRAHFLDAARLFTLLHEVGGAAPDRIAAMGGSQGGALAFACAALRPQVAKVAAHYPFLCDIKQVYDDGMEHSAYGELLQYFRRRDPLHLREAQAFERLAYIDLKHLAPWVKAEVLFGATLRDQACPPKSQLALYQSLACRKELLSYPDHGHEWLPEWDDRVARFLYPLLDKQP